MLWVLLAVIIPTLSRSPCGRPDRPTLDQSATRSAFTMTSLVFTRQARSQSEMPSNVTRCKRCIAYPGDCSLSGRQCPLAWRCALENDQPAPEQAAHDGSGRHDVSHQGSILNFAPLRAVIGILRASHKKGSTAGMQHKNRFTAAAAVSHAAMHRRLQHS